VLARVRLFLALSVSEQFLLFAALAIVAVVRTLLWLLPSRVSLRLVRRMSGLAAHAPPARRPSVECIAWTVRAASRVVPGATCLTQAAAAQLLLWYYGHDSTLCLGVAKSTGADFLAHAWIEHEQRVLVGGAHSANFARLKAIQRAVPQDRQPHSG
jgi:hypothetical protein